MCFYKKNVFWMTPLESFTKKIQFATLVRLTPNLFAIESKKCNRVHTKKKRKCFSFFTPIFSDESCVISSTKGK